MSETGQFTIFQVFAELEYTISIIKRDLYFLTFVFNRQKQLNNDEKYSGKKYMDKTLFGRGIVN